MGTVGCGAPAQGPSPLGNALGGAPCLPAAPARPPFPPSLPLLPYPLPLAPSRPPPGSSFARKRKTGGPARAQGRPCADPWPARHWVARSCLGIYSVAHPAGLRQFDPEDQRLRPPSAAARHLEEPKRSVFSLHPPSAAERAAQGEAGMQPAGLDPPLASSVNPGRSIIPFVCALPVKQELRDVKQKSQRGWGGTQVRWQAAPPGKWEWAGIAGFSKGGGGCG
jgi:hypothetical protein